MPGLHGSNQAHGSARLSAGLGNGQAHQAASTGRPQSALSISFEPLCTLQCVGLQGCLRNRSEKSIRPNLRITFRFDYHQTRLVERFTNLQ